MMQATGISCRFGLALDIEYNIFIYMGHTILVSSSSSSKVDIKEESYWGAEDNGMSLIYLSNILVKWIWRINHWIGDYSSNITRMTYTVDGCKACFFDTSLGDDPLYMRRRFNEVLAM